MPLLLYSRPVLQRRLSIFSVVCSDFLGSSLVGLAHPTTYLHSCVAIIAWCLSTQDILWLYGRSMDNRCPICKSSLESITHLFLFCPFAVEAWRAICGCLGSHFGLLTWLWICGYLFIAGHFILRFFSYGWLRCYTYGISSDKLVICLFFTSGSSPFTIT